jgi:hypothetical protein
MKKEKQKKQEYLSPTTETLVVRFEGSLLINSPASKDNTEPFGSGWDDDL